MTALINKLDNYTPTQSGENGHLEYTWSNDIQEQICQFSSQLTRTHHDGVESLRSQYNAMLAPLFFCLAKRNIEKKMFSDYRFILRLRIKPRRAAYGRVQISRLSA